MRLDGSIRLLLAAPRYANTAAGRTAEAAAEMLPELRKPTAPRN